MEADEKEEKKQLGKDGSKGRKLSRTHVLQGENGPGVTQSLA